MTGINLSETVVAFIRGRVFETRHPSPSSAPYLLFFKIKMSFNDETAIISWRKIPNLKCDVVSPNSYSPLRHNATLTFSTTVDTKFASISVAEAKIHNHFAPTPSQLLKHPLAALAFVPRDAALFAAGAFAGAAAKTFTAPLDRIKLLMQVRITHF